ncbi:MAG: SRPBCC domain-containing protein [Phenylobacterium sp.]
MTQEPHGPTTLASRLIAATPEALYGAFMDPEALVEWLPPDRMTGRIHSFEPRIGGGFEMSLFHPANERRFRGKTSEREDRVRVRFTDLAPSRHIVQAVSFVSDDPGFGGEMTMTWTFEAAPGGTRVSVLTANLPSGLRPQDNQTGSEMSLAQLARRLEA